MNPSPHQLAAQRDANERDRVARAARQDQLHQRAVARRRKAKRGGPR